MESIGIKNDIFDGLRNDFDDVISEIIPEMIRYNVPSGKITIGINISLSKLSYTDPNTGELKDSIVPDFSHTIKSSLKHDGTSVKGNSTGTFEVMTEGGNVVISKIDDGQLKLFY